MSSDLSRETKGDATGGIPWQIIYAAFLGETLCGFGIYGGLYLLGAKFGWMGRAGGVLTLVVAIALGVAFAALMTGAVWAQVTCRTFAIVSAAAFLAVLARAFFAAGHSLGWKFLDSRTWWLMSDMLFDPTVLLALGGVGVSLAMIWFLSGHISRRFFSR
jgi:hypothetical protein